MKPESGHLLSFVVLPRCCACKRRRSLALHIWAMSHSIASLFGRGDAARRTLPMSPEELLEAAVLVYLRGLGLPAAKTVGAELAP